MHFHIISHCVKGAVMLQSRQQGPDLTVFPINEMVRSEPQGMSGPLCVGSYDKFATNKHLSRLCECSFVYNDAVIHLK